MGKRELIRNKDRGKNRGKRNIGKDGEVNQEE